MCRIARWSLRDLIDLDLDELRYWYGEAVEFKKALDKAEEKAMKAKR